MQEMTEFEAFKRLMERPSAKTGGDSDEICGGCKYHRTDFQYRFCQFTECPYIKGFKTYREKYYE